MMLCTFVALLQHLPGAKHLHAVFEGLVENSSLDGGF